MVDELVAEEMTQEDRLQAIAYQFIALYERWSEDRQAAAKQGADVAQLVNIFIEQVKQFKNLEPNIRQQLIASIQNSVSEATKTIGSEIGKQATRSVDRAAQSLKNSVERAQYTLDSYKNEVITTQWKVIITSTLTTVATCFLVFLFLMPKPILPLTSKQVNYLYSGQMMEMVWPKLSKKEQQHWATLRDQILHPEQNDNITSDN